MSQNQEPTGLLGNISTLAKTVGFAVTLLATPALFNATKLPLFRYFAEAWGRDLAGILVWLMAPIEAYLIYESAVFLFTGAMVWLTARAAMHAATRKFRD